MKFSKEIDFLKTGTRWQMSSGLRKHLKQLPYFLLFNYPKKLQTYNNLKEKNKSIENKEDKYKLNAYRSPSPMNELCDYICTWEKKNIMWENDMRNLIDTRVLIINNDLDLSDRKIMKIVRRYINKYVEESKKHLEMRKNMSYANDDDGSHYYSAMDLIIEKIKTDLLKELNLDEETIANYVIKVSYANLSTKKSFAWIGYGNYIIKNLRNNSNPKRYMSINEIPYKTNNSYEYLGKFYEFKTAGE